MRLLDTYALATASKIDKPYIFEQYFPLPFEKYITIQGQSKYEAKDYAYWQDVINLLVPVMEKNGIKIVQVGGPTEMPYQNVVDLRGRTDINQLAYIINRSNLHVGPDSLGTHLASVGDVPLIGLYSVSQSSVSGPHFGSPEKQICFDAYLRTRNKKPSYADKEHPKSIDLIMPEEIVDAAFKLLGLKETCPIKTVHMGSRYNSGIHREFIPTKAGPIANPEHPIEIRMDIHFDEAVLAQQLQLCRAIIITNKRINKDLLKRFRGHIATLAYVIDDNDEPAFIKDIKDVGIHIALQTYLTDEQIQDKKINYYEYGNINILAGESKEVVDKLKPDIDNLYYRSNKLVADGDKLFSSNCARVNGDEITNDFSYYKASDCPEFWRDLPFMTVVKQVEKPA
jgi:hypothetical protein